MTNQNNPRLLAIFNAAKHQNTISLYLGYLALVCFALFGTLASMAAFKDSTLIYLCFHYLPYILIGFSIPITLYHLFLMVRYRIIQFMMVVIILGFGILLPLASLIFYMKGASFNGSMALFVGMIAWFCAPYLLKVSLKRFLDFLNQKSTPTTQAKKTQETKQQAP